LIAHGYGFAAVPLKISIGVGFLNWFAVSFISTVAVPCPPTPVPDDGLVSLRKIVSVGSSRRSPHSVINIVLLVSPGPNVTVRLTTEMKSALPVHEAPGVAVPPGTVFTTNVDPPTVSPVRVITTVADCDSSSMNVADLNWTNVIGVGVGVAVGVGDGVGVAAEPLLNDSVAAVIVPVSCATQSLNFNIHVPFGFAIFPNTASSETF